MYVVYIYTYVYIYMYVLQGPLPEKTISSVPKAGAPLTARQPGQPSGLSVTVNAAAEARAYSPYRFARSCFSWSSQACIFI